MTEAVVNATEVLLIFLVVYGLFRSLRGTRGEGVIKGFTVLFGVFFLLGFALTHGLSAGNAARKGRERPFGAWRRLRREWLDVARLRAFCRGGPKRQRYRLPAGMADFLSVYETYIKTQELGRRGRDGSRR